MVADYSLQLLCNDDFGVMGQIDTKQIMPNADVTGLAPGKDEQ